MFSKNAPGLALFVICVASLSSCKDRGPVLDLHGSETEAEYAEAIRDAYSEGSSVGNGQLKRDIEIFFSDLQRKSANGDSKGISAMFSEEAITQLIFESPLLAGEKPYARRKMSKATGRGFTSSVGNVLTQNKFLRIQVNKVKRLNPSVATAFTSSVESTFFTTVKQRWWLIRTTTGWKIFDMADLTTGLRTSSMMVNALKSSDISDKNHWSKLTQRLVKMNQSSDAFELLGDVETIEQLNHTVQTSLSAPDEVRAYSLMNLATSYSLNEKYVEANATLDQMAQIPGATPFHHYLRGSNLIQLEKYEEGRAELTRYTDQLGIDSDAYEVLADSYLLQENYSKAGDIARKGVDLNSCAIGSYSILALTLSDEEFATFPDYTSGSPLEADIYYSAIDFLICYEKTSRAKILFDQMQKIAPADPRLKDLEAYFAELPTSP